MFGKEFQQNSVGHPAVQNDDGFNPINHSVNAGFKLRNHATGDGSICHQGVGFGDGKAGDECSFFVENTAHIGKKEKTLGICGFCRNSE